MRSIDFIDLSDWMDLGKKYPKAIEALKAIRDRKTAQLAAGKYDFDTFMDVVAINEQLGDASASVETFKQIAASSPGEATGAYSVVEETLVNAKEFALARQYMGDPAERLATATRNVVGSRGSGSRKGLSPDAPGGLGQQALHRHRSSHAPRAQRGNTRISCVAPG